MSDKIEISKTKAIEELVKENVYGIDLGTTYSAITWINEFGKSETFVNSDGDLITPSVVFFESKENLIVGKEAKEAGQADPERVVDLIKREIGQETTRTFDGVEYSPERISSLILKRLITDVRAKGKEVDRAVITCPAYFNPSERAATRAAGEMAGIEVLGILEEPVAAALQFCDTEVTEPRNVIVYDLGGGTFDVTIVSMSENGDVEVVCTDGDHRLGGADWDLCMCEILEEKFYAEHQTETEIKNDPCSLYETKLKAERMKKILSKRENTMESLMHEGLRARITVTRTEFNEKTKHLLDKTKETTRKMIDFAKEKGITKIHHFLLVGGSTRMLQVQEMVAAEFCTELGVEPTLYDPDESVAKGAARYARLQWLKKVEEERLRRLAAPDNVFLPSTAPDGLPPTPTDGIVLPSGDIKTVASKSCGIRILKDGVPAIYNMILKQAPLPFEYSQEIPVSEDNCTSVLLDVYYCNEVVKYAKVEQCEELGKAMMELDSPLSKMDKIKVTLGLNKEGAVTLSATDMKSGKHVDAHFDAKGAVSEADIEAAKRDKRAAQ